MGTESRAAMILAAVFAFAMASGADAAQLRRSAFLSAGRAGDRTVAALLTCGQPVDGVSAGGGATLWHGWLGPLGPGATGVGPTAPVDFALASPAPNPCASGVAIRYRAAPGSAATLSVYDLRGRRVRRFACDESGRDRVLAWRLDGDDGRRVAAGVYLMRLEAAGVRLARRVVVTP